MTASMRLVYMTELLKEFGEITMVSFFFYGKVVLLFNYCCAS